MCACSDDVTGVDACTGSSSSGRYGSNLPLPTAPSSNGSEQQVIEPNTHNLADELQADVVPSEALGQVELVVSAGAGVDSCHPIGAGAHLLVGGSGAARDDHVAASREARTASADHGLLDEPPMDVPTGEKRVHHRE